MQGARQARRELPSLPALEGRDTRHTARRDALLTSASVSELTSANGRLGFKKDGLFKAVIDAEKAIDKIATGDESVEQLIKGALKIL